MLRASVIVFPGSNCDRDVKVALERVTGFPVKMVWHGDAIGARLRPHRAAGRLLLRRLSALRRHGGAFADHARRHRQGESRHAGARHLQRLPDPVRVGPAARRADAQRLAAIHLPRRAPCKVDNDKTFFTKCYRKDRGHAPADRARARATTSPTRRRSTASKAKAASCSAIAMQHGEVDAASQPQRRPAQHRRHQRRDGPHRSA